MRAFEWQLALRLYHILTLIMNHLGLTARGAIAKWLRRQIRTFLVICFPLGAQVRVLLASKRMFCFSPTLHSQRTAGTPFALIERLHLREERK